MTKSYELYDGLARALDVVGDRWNLLIVRQLLIAGARYGELLDKLPGLATNLLTERLRALEAAAVVERRLGAAGSAVEYALTPWGAELREPIEGLIRWSLPLLNPDEASGSFRPEWLIVALPALLGPRRAVDAASPLVGIAIAGELIEVQLTGSGVEASLSDGRDLDATIFTDVSTVLGLATGVLPVDQALELLVVEGDEAAVRAVFGREVHPAR